MLTLRIRAQLLHLAVKYATALGSPLLALVALLYLTVVRKAPAWDLCGGHLPSPTPTKVAQSKFTVSRERTIRTDKVVIGLPGVRY